MNSYLSRGASRLGLTLAIALMGSLSTNAGAQTVNLSSPAAVKVDMAATTREIEGWRRAKQDELRRSGKATAEEFRRVDEEALTRARQAEARRADALSDLSEHSGGADIKQGSGGTEPTKGRGVLGDVDTKSLKATEFDKVRKAALKAGYHVEGEGDAFTIKELDTTVHRESARQASYGSAENTGSSGHAAETARGANAETAMGLNANDPALNVADNLKKAAHTLDTPAGSISSEELQKLGKMTGRNMDAINQINPEATVGDPTLRRQADLLKQGYSPELAGIVRDNATPQERIQDIADFQNRSREVNVEAVRAADQHVGREMDRLAGDARHANEVLEATRQTGDPDRIAAARQRAADAEAAIIDFQETHAAAREVAVTNDAGAAKIMNEARGVNTAGETPSQIRETAVAPERQALTKAVEAPSKPSTPGSTAEGAAGEAAGGEVAAGRGSTVVKGLSTALVIYNTYEGVMRGSAEAGKEAAENGDSAAKSAAKTVGYSAWYGLGFGGAAETGKRAGEASAQQWAEDVKAGRVDPDSKLSRAWAQLRGVGWGVAEFTGLQAIKDATVEGAGYVKDRYSQYKAEGAQSDQQVAEAQRAADRAAAKAEKAIADKTAADKIVSDRPAADKTGADASTAEKPPSDKTTPGLNPEDKAAADRLAAEKAVAEKAAADKAAADKAAAARQAAAKRAAEKAAADKLAAEKAAADKAASEASDKAAADKAAADLAAQAPSPPSPEPQTSIVDAGSVTDKNGVTKLFYIKNANGETIGGYYVHFDKQGREIGRESFTSSPEAAGSASLDGAYNGRITGSSTGSIRLTVNGRSVSGSINGQHQGDRISANFSGSLDSQGHFSAPAQGVLTGELFGKMSTFPFSGSVNGRVDGRSGAGAWSGKNQWGSSQGTWQASK